MRRPLSQGKRKRGESGQEDETTQPGEKRSKYSRAESTPDSQVMEQEGYDTNMKKLHAELKLDTPRHKKIKRLM